MSSDRTQNKNNSTQSEASGRSRTFAPPETAQENSFSLNPEESIEYDGVPLYRSPLQDIAQFYPDVKFSNTVDVTAMLKEKAERRKKEGLPPLQPKYQPPFAQGPPARGTVDFNAILKAKAIQREAKEEELQEKEKSNKVQRQVYGNSPTGKTDPRAIIPVESFIHYIRNVESAYPQDSPSGIVSRIRVQYYSGVAFHQLIPNADVPGTLSKDKVEEEAYNHLTARADENSKGDNPSPYIRLQNGKQVDLGHLLLGLDALLHPGTGKPYSAYKVPGIDPASWVADIGIAAVWMTQHEENNEPPSEAPSPPSSPNLDAYYKISAPEEDLLGDVDSFGVHNQWNQMPNESLSTILEAYYIGSMSKTIGANQRWQIFCAKNGFTYSIQKNNIIWSNKLEKAVITRVNRFNNLYAAGKAGSIWGTLFGPSKREWPHTPQVVRKFLNWVKINLEQELKN